MSRVVLMKMAMKAWVAGVLAVLAAGAIVAQASENSAAFQAPEQATETVTPTETPAPTDTPAPTASDTPTATPSDTPTPPATSTASPTITGTPPTATPPPAPNIPFLFAASGSQPQNQWSCTFDLAAKLGLSGAEKTFQTIADSDPAALRNVYKVIYVAPGLNSEDYGFLQQMVTNGTIEQFVSSGGVAVINAAGASNDQPNIAPDGVGFLFSAAAHDSETIEAKAANHPYITGVGFGGDALGDADFEGWQPTDLGTLTGLPEGATVVLTNGDPSWVEYRHGDGRVIVTTLTYCTSSEPNSQGAAAQNLLRYSSFFKGSAFTPAPTVTLTPRLTPTKTPTPRPSATASATLTATLTPVPSPSASPTSMSPTPTPTGTPTSSPGSTTTPTDTVTPAPTASPTLTPTNTATPTASEAPSETATPTATATTTSSATPTEAPTATATATELASATPTEPPTPTPTATAVTASCAGDCNKDHVVTVDEVLVVVQIALGNDDITMCDQVDVNGDGRVTVDEILMAVSNALNGCPSGAPPT